MAFTPEEQEIIRKRRELLAPIYGDEVKNISDADILSFTEEHVQGLLMKTEPPAATKADIDALLQVIERQGRALDDFAKHSKAQDEAIGQVSKNVEQVAQAVTPLMTAFAEFNKTDPAAAGGAGKALVAGNGNGGGKMDLMALLGNPLIQKFLGASGGEQQNPMEYFVNQVKQVTTLLSTLDEIRGGANRNINGIKPANLDMSTLLKGMQWGYRIKNGQLPPGLLQALGGDENGSEAVPNIIVVQQPAETVKHRRDPDDEHRV